jgi:DNA-binding transcriptional regulator YiaG
MSWERAPPSACSFPVNWSRVERREMYGVMDGEKIEAMRQERGLSRRGLAERAGLTVETVARVERGERVRRATGWKVARVFGTHPSEIGRPAS